MRVAAALALLLALGGCKKETHLAGVDKWHVEKTTRKDATGRCIPEKLGDGREAAYCVGQPALTIASSTADVILYFDGFEPQSKLVELQLDVTACDVEKLEAWLRTNFGGAAETGASRKAWKNPHLLAVAELPLPGEPRCLIRMLPVGEQARFDAIWGKPPA